MPPSESKTPKNSCLLLGANTLAGAAIQAALLTRGDRVTAVDALGEPGDTSAFADAAERLASVRTEGPFDRLIIASTLFGSAPPTDSAGHFAAGIALPLVFLRSVGKDLATAGRGQILMLSSELAFGPRSGAAHAGAVAAWVASLGSALREEWRTHDISVTVYCQGPEEFDAERALAAMVSDEGLVFSDRRLGRRARQQIRRGSPAVKNAP